MVCFSIGELSFKLRERHFADPPGPVTCGKRGSGSTDSDRTPWAPWINTPSMSAVAEGPVWNTA